MGNNGTSANKLAHAYCCWRLNELADGVVTKEVGYLSQTFTTPIEKEDSSKAPTWTLQNFERMTSKAWPHWWNKIEAGVQIQSSGKHIVSS